MSAIAWTEKRVEALKKFWAAGLSASQCACELHDGEFKGLPPLSRNAVIGKVHRLGLSGRKKETSSAKPKRPRTVVRRDPVARVNTQSIRQARIEAAEERAEEIAYETVVPTAQSVGLLDLTDALCHWPQGDPQLSDFHFCGGRALAGRPYCAHHSRIAYQPSSDRRRAPTYEISDAERARRADLGKRMAARAHAKRMGVE
jgi:GcrA cell cycle regulator